MTVNASKPPGHHASMYLPTFRMDSFKPTILVLSKRVAQMVSFVALNFCGRMHMVHFTRDKSTLVFVQI